jgi:hypothetical protein
LNKPLKGKEKREEKGCNFGLGKTQQQRKQEKYSNTRTRAQQVII